jgi:hypothetical protein
LPPGRNFLLARFWKRIRSRQSNSARKGERIRREFIESRKGQFTKPPGDVCSEQMRATVHDVDRLAVSRFAGVSPRERGRWPLQNP